MCNSSRRSFLSGAVASASACILANPIRSSIGSRASYGRVDEESYTPVTALRNLAINPYQRIGVDSGIICPSEGDFCVETDFVYFQTFPERPREAYWVIGGISPFADPHGFSIFGHVNYRNTYYASGGKTKFYYKSPIGITSGAYAVRGGIVDGMEYLEVNGVVMTNPLDGTDRGNGVSPFWFLSSYPNYSNYSGTILGEVRLFQGTKKVFDGRPCIRDSDGVCGYYDVVQGRFCPAVGEIAPWN